MTAEELAWKKAQVIATCDPEHDRQDEDGMPMQRELFNRPHTGGWAVNEQGEAEAYKASGLPATGDKPLSSVVTSYYLPSEIRTVV